MIRVILKTFLSLVISTTCISQVDPMNFDYSRVDSIVTEDFLKTDFKSSKQIADLVNARFNEEHEKFRAVYMWITSTIAYDYSYEGTNADSVVLLKTAVCGGYSSLLKSICDQININCKYVSGYCHNNSYSFDPLPEESDHAWNIVTLGGLKYLTDVTWASGYSETDDDTFIREFNESYFLVKPEQFIYDHYPDSSQNSLLENEIDIKDFEIYPGVEDGFREFEMSNIKPSTRIIECTVNEKVYFGFSTPIDDLEFVELCIEDSSGNEEWISFAYARNGNDISFWWEFVSTGTYKVTMTLLEDRVETINYKVVVH